MNTGNSFSCAAIVLCLALALSVGLWSPGASAAISAEPVFSVGSGSILPNGGGAAEVSISCPDGATGACHGSLTLVPRGNTVRTLGSRTLARSSFRLADGADADLKLRLSTSARDALSRGPLYVTAVLRAAGSPVIAKLPATLAAERPFTASTPPSVAAPYECWPNAHCVDFSWSWKKIPAAHYLVMKSFSCPADEPRVAPGNPIPRQARDGTWFNSFRGKLEASASNGTEYAGFNKSNVSRFDDPERRGNGNGVYHMLGWPQGSVFDNSIWAPLTRDGQFSLKVTCTSAPGYGAAYLDSGFSKFEAMFFPWG